MTHYRFQDDTGIWWDTWDVWPTSTERRERERRANARLSETRSLPLGSAERRKPGDRRTRAEPRVPVSLGMQSGWVVFQSSAERRRLAPIPAEWDRLCEHELRELCARAAAVGRPRRLME